VRLEYFQMIDRIDAFDAEARTIAATANVPAESPIFEGHFPGLPLMPGVLLIETMAQASGFMLLALNGFSRMPFFAGVKKGKLRDFVKPETTLAVRARMAHDGSGFAVTEAEIGVDGKPTCDAELTFRLMPFDRGPLYDAIRSRAREIGLLAMLGNRSDAG
jgi:3-hydroxyacyl-[acyl-carrier-protein] dehydratase